MRQQQVPQGVAQAGGQAQVAKQSQRAGRDLPKPPAQQQSRRREHHPAEQLRPGGDAQRIQSVVGGLRHQHRGGRAQRRGQHQRLAQSQVDLQPIQVDRQNAREAQQTADQLARGEAILLPEQKRKADQQQRPGLLEQGGFRALDQGDAQVGAGIVRRIAGQRDEQYGAQRAPLGQAGPKRTSA